LKKKTPQNRIQMKAIKTKGRKRKDLSSPIYLYPHSSSKQQQQRRGGSK